MLPEGVLFDLDGTLLETERLALECFEAACADVGVVVSRETYLSCIGTTYERTAEILTEAGGDAFPLDALSERWSERYQARIAHEPVPFRPGVPELIERLSALDLPMAVVTSSRRASVVKKLQAARVLDRFEFLICAGESGAGKPDPAPYLDAAARLSLSPGRCWALEDSASGTRSAFDAGCTVFQVPDLLPPPRETLGSRHRLLGSAHEILPLLVR